MNSEASKIEIRKNAAIHAIRSAYVAENDVGLFVLHHLEEIESSYWQEHLKTTQPTPKQVLGILVLRSHWGGESGDSTFDFTLPQEITNYILSVSFDDNGGIKDIAMES